MRERALVIKTDGEHATVSVDKKDECSKCGMCAFPKGANKIELRAKNPVKAKEGDRVIIERQEGGKLSGAILVFLIPLILIGLATFITYAFIGNEIWILFLSLIFILLWYTILAIIDKKLVFLDKFCSVIVEIEKGEDDERTIHNGQTGI